MDFSQGSWILLMYCSLNEDDVLNSDIYGLISPYATANFWVRRGERRKGGVEYSFIPPPLTLSKNAMT